MKMPSRRFIITQCIIVLIALSFFVAPMLINAYLSRHVVHPCSSESVLARTCAHDTRLTTWLNASHNWYTGTTVFEIQNDLSNTIHNPLRSLPGAFGKYLPALATLLTLIAIFNIVWLAVNRLVHLKSKEPTSKTSVLSKR